MDSNTNAELMLPAAYVRRSTHPIASGAPNHNADKFLQPDVYPFAERIALRIGAERVVDLGCGDGSQLAAFDTSIETVGVDHPQSIAKARRDFPERNWVEHDLETDLGSLHTLIQNSLIVCANLAECVERPLQLLRFLRSILADTYGIILTASDRDRAYGPGNLGPPADPSVLTEWTLSEFASLLRKEGLVPLAHGHMRTGVSGGERAGQIAFVPGGKFLQPASGLRPRVLAVVPCFNELDMIQIVIDRLLDQGVEVHVIDNWSSDGTWEHLNTVYAHQPRVALERFPDAPTEDFMWANTLERMDAIGAASAHDWILHVDADEKMDSFTDELSLLNVIAMADHTGYDVIDFTLIDFRPDDSVDWEREAAAPPLPSRWHFGTRPGAKTLERAWKNRRSRAGIADTGGHALTIPKKVFPFNLILRHYPLRSPEHARRKIYVERGPRNLAERARRGWWVQYDAFSLESSFVWAASSLHEWNQESTREWMPEFSARAGITFGDYGLPPGMIEAPLPPRLSLKQRLRKLWQ